MSNQEPPGSAGADSTPGPGNSQAKPPSTSGDAGTKARWAWLNLPVVVALIGFPVAIASVLVDHLLNHQTQSVIGSPHLELDSLSVQPGAYPHPVTMSFKLRNTGTQLAIVTGVRFRVLRSERLPECITQGALPTTGHYKATLPADARPGTVVDVPVSQQLGPDTADQFEISLHAGPDVPATIRLYDLTVSLLYDKANALGNVGSVVVALPFYPPYGARSAYYWTQASQQDLKAPASHPGNARFFALYANDLPWLTRCLIDNSRRIRTFISSTRGSSPELSHLLPLLTYCCVAKPPPISVVSCGRPLIKPSSLSIGCARTVPGIRLEKMRWSSWGWEQGLYKGTATGTGTVRLLYCPTTSSTGLFKGYAVRVSFSDPQIGRYGWAWNAISIHFLNAHPYGERNMSFGDLTTPISSTCQAQ